MICKLLGTPSESDIAFLTDASARYHVKLVSKYDRVDWHSLFPAAPPEALELLREMLVFNPDKRVTANEALAHRFFEEVRSLSLEAKSNPSIFDLDSTTDYITTMLEICGLSK